MTTWLVTGGSGFVGRHVLDAIEADPEPGRSLVSIGRRAPTRALGRFVTVDLDSREEIFEVVQSLSPAYVIHAAGRTPPGSAVDFYRSNTMATLHLLDALRSLGRPVRVVLVGSAAELGPVPVDRLPVGEGEPCRPADAYGLSKLLATTAGIASRPPLEVISARVFNPIGPGLPATQALGRFAEMLATAPEGPIRLCAGNLDARRDFVDVRDVASALVSLAIRGRPGSVYNIGTGHSRRVGDGLEALIALSGRDVEVVPDPSAPAGPGDSRAEIRRIVEDAGWSPRIPWERSLADLLEAAIGAGGRH